MRRAAALVAGVLALATLACRPSVRVGSPCQGPRAFAPFDDHPRVARDRAEPEGGREGMAEGMAEGMIDAIVAWYQRHGRARSLPGVGCPFAPTCSAYARAALHRYGPLAVILIVDRLFVREHAIAGAYYPPICVAHTTRLVDGVP